MGKLAERFINFMKRKYEKKNLDWNRSDNIIWGFWSKVFPILILIPIMFFALKYLLIDYLLANKGFEKTIMYIAIILIIRPMIMDFFVRWLKFKDEMKK